MVVAPIFKFILFDYVEIIYFIAYELGKLLVCQYAPRSFMGLINISATIDFELMPQKALIVTEPFSTTELVLPDD